MKRLLIVSKVRRRGMKRLLIVSAMLIAALIIVQCGGAPPATEVPTPTEALPTKVPPTEKPTATAVPPTEKPTATRALPTETPMAVEIPTALDGKSLLENRCTICHDLGRVERARKSEAEWKDTVRRMVGKGAQLNQAEQEAVIKYLAETYGR